MRLGGTCSTYVGEERFIQDLVGENLKERKHLEDLDIGGRFAECNQQDATSHKLFISVTRCTCFRRVFRPSSGAQNCTYRVSICRRGVV